MLKKIVVREWLSLPHRLVVRSNPLCFTTHAIQFCLSNQTQMGTWPYSHIPSLLLGIFVQIINAVASSCFLLCMPLTKTRFVRLQKQKDWPKEETNIKSLSTYISTTKGRWKINNPSLPSFEERKPLRETFKHIEQEKSCPVFSQGSWNLHFSSFK